METKEAAKVKIIKNDVEVGGVIYHYYGISMMSDNTVETFDDITDDYGLIYEFCEMLNNDAIDAVCMKELIEDFVDSLYIV